MTATDIDHPRVSLLLALADDELVLGHRHVQWTGVAPHVEEDLAFSSIAQDELGHAQLWYGIAAALLDEDPDRLALARPPEQYRHAVLVERENRDWGYTIARHYLYDTAEDIRLRALADSSWRDVADATGAILREERYHLEHARTWVRRLAHGPAEARERLAGGLRSAAAEAPGLFARLPGEEDLLAEGVLPADHHTLRARWLDLVAGELEALGLGDVLDGVARRAGSGWIVDLEGAGGRRGEHSADWAPLWAEMTGLYRAAPGASW